MGVNDGAEKRTERKMMAEGVGTLVVGIVGSLCDVIDSSSGIGRMGLDKRTVGRVLLDRFSPDENQTLDVGQLGVDVVRTVGVAMAMVKHSDRWPGLPEETRSILASGEVDSLRGRLFGGRVGLGLSPEQLGSQVAIGVDLMVKKGGDPDKVAKASSLSLLREVAIRKRRGVKK
jgi:hypothetical protein